MPNRHEQAYLQQTATRSVQGPEFHRRPLALAFAAITSVAFAQASLAAEADAEGAVTLRTLKVKGTVEADVPPAAPGGQAGAGARIGMLGNVDVLDAPVSINAYTSQLMKDQQARTVADVLQNDPAVRFTTNSGHMLEHFKIRGLDVNGPSIAFNGLFGMAPKGHIPTEFLERTEVLRGPSAMIFGMAPDANLGGTINLVSKRAGQKPVFDLTTSYSSDSYWQEHVDIGRSFGDVQQLGIRFNGAYGKGDTGVADQEKERQLGALALDYRVERLSLQLDAYSSREKIENGSPAMYGLTARRGPVVGLGQRVSIPDSDANLFEGTKGLYTNEGVTLRAEYDFSDNLAGYIALGTASSRGDGLMFGTRVIVRNADGTAAGYVYNVNTITRDRTAETGLNASFATGSIGHTLNASLSVLKHEEGSTSTRNEGWLQNIYEPVAPVLPGKPADAKYDIDNLLNSLAITDTLDLANGRALVTLGARLQRVRQRDSDYDESRISPALGVVVKPWSENTSLFANYMEGLSAGETVPAGYDNEGSSFKPIQTEQIEIGVKQRLGSITHTFSVFRIERPTIVDSEDGLRREEGGDLELKGAEWNLFGQISPTVSLLGGVAWLDSEEKDTGNESFAVPNWTANLGADWATPLTGLNVGGRIVYTGKQWVDSDNTLRLPSWTRFDLTAKYQTQIANTPVVFNAFVENLADRDYWAGNFADGYVMTGGPRTFRLAATVSL